MNALTAILSLVLCLTTGFANAQTVIHPAKPAAPNPVLQGMSNGVNGIGQGLGNVAKGTAQGTGWFFQELLRPVEAMRVGIIDMFGVKEESGRKRT